VKHHSRPYRAEVKNAWSYTSILHTSYLLPFTLTFPETLACVSQYEVMRISCHVGGFPFLYVTTSADGLPCCLSISTANRDKATNQIPFTEIDSGGTEGLISVVSSFGCLRRAVKILRTSTLAGRGEMYSRTRHVARMGQMRIAYRILAGNS
jgi:hypothetical protein